RPPRSRCTGGTRRAPCHRSADPISARRPRPHRRERRPPRRLRAYESSDFSPGTNGELLNDTAREGIVLHRSRGFRPVLRKTAPPGRRERKFLSSPRRGRLPYHRAEALCPRRLLLLFLHGPEVQGVLVPVGTGHLDGLVRRPVGAE